MTTKNIVLTSQQQAELLRFKALATLQPKRKLVLIGSSHRFNWAFNVLNLYYSKQGYIVQSIGYIGQSDDTLRAQAHITEEHIQNFEIAYFQAIEEADVVIVINPHLYIGQSTKIEYALAQQYDKAIVHVEIEPGQWEPRRELWMQGSEERAR